MKGTRWSYSAFILHQRDFWVSNQICAEAVRSVRGPISPEMHREDGFKLEREGKDMNEVLKLTENACF